MDKESPDTDLMARAEQRFGSLSEAERKVLAAVLVGEVATCGPAESGSAAAESDPAKAESWGEDRTLRATLLEWLCTDKGAREHIHRFGIRVSGARIKEHLDLSFAKLAFPLRFDACRWHQGITLENASLPELGLTECRLDPVPPTDAQGRRTALNARGMQVRGSVFLNGEFHADGEVRLDGARIGGSLDCARATFKNPTGRALSAMGAKIDGDVFLAPNFRAEGELRLYAAEIGGNLECDGASLKNDKGYALQAEGAKIGGAVLLRNKFKAEGQVRLFGAEIGSNLECDGASLKNDKRYALNVGGAKIGGAVHLRNKFQAEGEVRFLGAEIASTLDCKAGTFRNANGAALNAYRAKVGGDLLLSSGFKAEGWIFISDVSIGGSLDLRARKNDAEQPGADAGASPGADTVVHLADASCDVLIDDPEGWPANGNLRLDGFVYRRIDSPGSAASRLDWLRRQLPPAKRDRRGRFRPQPYRQLAGVLRAQGLDAEAKSILIGMAEDRRKWAELGPGSRFWQWVLWIAIRNGHQPLRAFSGLLILWAIGFLAFGWGYQMQAMVPSDRFAYQELESGKPLPGQYDPFCALVYAVDAGLPIISFGQRDRWHPGVASARPETDGGVYGTICYASFMRHWDPHRVWVDAPALATWLAMYRWFHIALGWFLATMLVAGISGLVGRE